MDIPLYSQNNDSTSSVEQDYNQQLNATLSDNLGIFGFNITPISSTDLTTTSILNPNTGDLTTVMDLAEVGAMWIVMNANLGILTILGTGALAAGKFVVNTIDLTGTYTIPEDLADYINTGVVPGITAQILGGNFYLISSGIITVSTSGSVGSNGLTFSGFSLTGAAASQIVAPKWVGKQSSSPTILQQFTTSNWP